MAAAFSARAGVSVQSNSRVQRFLSSPPPELRWGTNGQRSALLAPKLYADNRGNEW